MALEDLSSVIRQTSVHFYEAPVHIWHWSNAPTILVLIVTGCFIGSPPLSMGVGEASQHFLFGYLRFTHFAAGMILTGMALCAEGPGLESFLDLDFGWVRHLVGDSQTLYTLHHLGMWFSVIFMIVHIYVAIREDIMNRQSIVSTMISGHRTFKDDRRD